MKNVLFTVQKSTLNSDQIFTVILLLLWVCTQRLSNKHDHAQDEEGQEQWMDLMVPRGETRAEGTRPRPELTPPDLQDGTAGTWPRREKRQRGFLN